MMAAENVVVELVVVVHAVSLVVCGRRLLFAQWKRAYLCIGVTQYYVTFLRCCRF